MVLGTDYHLEAVSCSATNLPGDLMLAARQETSGPTIQVVMLDNASVPWTIQVPELPTHLCWAHPESGLLAAAATRTGHIYILEGPRPSLSPAQAPSYAPLALTTGTADTDMADAQGAAGPPGAWTVRSTLKSSATSPITHISFAPHQLGLLLSATCADGQVLMWEADRPLAPNSWCLQAKFRAGTNSSSMGPSASSSVGCVGLSWRGFTAGVAPLLAVGLRQGVEVWQYYSPLMKWQCVASIPLSSEQPCSCLRWAPPLNRPLELLAAGHGNSVDVLTIQGDTTDLRTELVQVLDQHDAAVWKVEFNACATQLAVCSEDAAVHVYQINLLGEWQYHLKFTGCLDVDVE